MARPNGKSILLAIILTLAVLDTAQSLLLLKKAKKLAVLNGGYGRYGRDTSGHFHPELHGDGARGHFHSVHLHSHDAGGAPNGELTSISSSSSSGDENRESHNFIAASTGFESTGQVVREDSRGYAYPQAPPFPSSQAPPAPSGPPSFPSGPPGPPPGESYDIQPNCGCLETGRCDRSLIDYTDHVLRTTETIVCGTAFRLCCYPDPWPGVKDAFKHLAPCVPTEQCVHGYGDEATDVAFFGVIGPCPGLGTVRCMDKITPVSALPIPSQEGPIHIVLPIIENPVPATPPVKVDIPVIPELPIPTTVYEPPGQYIVPEPVPVPVTPTPGIYNPPPPPVVYNPPVPVPETPPPVIYNPPVPVTEPPVIYNPPVPVTEPPVIYNPPVPVTEPPVIYNPPVPVTEPPVIYNPPVPVTEPPVIYNPPVPVTVTPTPGIYDLPPPPVVYNPPVPVTEPPTSYAPPTPVVEPPVTYGVPGTRYGQPLSNYVPNQGFGSEFGGYRGFPYGGGANYGGFGGSSYYPGFYNSGFGFRKHFGFSKGFGFYG